MPKMVQYSNTDVILRAACCAEWLQGKMQLFLSQRSWKLSAVCDREAALDCSPMCSTEIAGQAGGHSSNAQSWGQAGGAVLHEGEPLLDKAQPLRPWERRTLRAAKCLSLGT